MNPTTTKTDRAEEADLVERLKKGQKWAFDRLVSQYQDRLLKIAYGITLDHEDSLEVVQDVFVSVYKNIHTFRQDSSLYTWLRKITVNHCLNWKRKWKRRFKWQHQSLDQEDDRSLDLESDEAGPESLMSNKQVAGVLKQGLDKLPEKARAVLVLKEVEGLSYEEIGDALGINKGTVSSRIFYAREKLREYLKGVESEG